jgi:DNA-directed RNA polymerase specialized sigma24 family protein
LPPHHHRSIPAPAATDRLAAAVGRLPELERHLLRLARDGATYRQAAAIVGLPEAHAARLLRAALRELRLDLRPPEAVVVA